MTDTPLGSIRLAWWERGLAFLAFNLCMALPGGWRGEPWRSVELWLLPHAAAWAYPWKLSK